MGRRLSFESLALDLKGNPRDGDRAAPCVRGMCGDIDDGELVITVVIRVSPTGFDGATPSQRDLAATSSTPEF